jgi:hypothetical protein
VVAIRRTVEIRERLAQENFAAYAPCLTKSLNNLSVDLAETGDRAGGLAAIRRAVEIYLPLARDFHSRHAQDLERCLALSRLEKVGRRELALGGRRARESFAPRTRVSCSATTTA